MRWVPFLLLLGISSADAAPRIQIRTFNRLDTDNDESVSAAELLAVTRNLDGVFEDTTALIHSWFDADESGGIDLGEWLDGRRGDGDPVAPDLTGEAALELDVNGNGKVSRREFRRVIRRFVPQKTTRGWYRAQFPDGQVTGSSWQSFPWWDFPIVVVGPNTPVWNAPLGGSGTLAVGSDIGTLSPGASPGVLAQWVMPNSGEAANRERK